MLLRHTSLEVVVSSAGSTGPSDEGQPEPKKRGRKPKTTAAEPAGADAAMPAAAEPPAPKKRGRKTKEETEQDIQAADEAFTALGQEEDDQAEAEVEEDLAITPAEGPGSWAEAAATTAGEEDRRRFPYHRCA